MLNDAQEFAESFGSENLLQQAVVGLLSKMPGIRGIQLLQGPLERGKDIVFWSQGGFGEALLCACVVKNVKITGSVRRSSGARTVLFQIDQAFDPPHIDENANEIRVGRVYVVTPYDVTPAAIESIVGKATPFF